MKRAAAHAGGEPLKQREGVRGRAQRLPRRGAELSSKTTWVAMANTAAKVPLNTTIARSVLQVPATNASPKTGSLQSVFAEEGVLSLEAFRFHFKEIVYLRVHSASIFCSCAASAMHGQCAHTTFVASLGLQAYSGTRIVLQDVPETRKRGGRKTASTAPPRKRRQQRKSA